MRRTLGTTGNRALGTSGNGFRGARNSRGARGPGTSGNGSLGSWNSWNSEHGEPWKSEVQGRRIRGARRGLEPRIMEFQVRRSLAFGRQPDIGSALFFQGRRSFYAQCIGRGGDWLTSSSAAATSTRRVASNAGGRGSGARGVALSPARGAGLRVEG